MRFIIIKVSDFISYFDYENFKGGIIVRNHCNKCKKKIVMMNKKADTIKLSLEYLPN